jgi:hypothetical protein
MKSRDSKALNLMGVLRKLKQQRSPKSRNVGRRFSRYEYELKSMSRRETINPLT